ncbi:low molecular weight protein-tyrosine-phosphatase [Microlunatus ginsengisoli]|uniref:protein-tyrosine-phosphatase n=1 Tax=Microlunatus ginsengisoli TaxID=363863 RepID=A0ABP7A1I5_9ACTN
MAGSDPLRVVFVCWGNICRSPMAERVAEKLAADRGLTEVEFSSAATSTEELGQPMDSRAEAVLRSHGYRVGRHRAHQITRDEIERADLVLAMEDIHVRRMLSIDPGADNIALLTDYDPGAEPGSGIDDPWYGPSAGFERTLASIEAAMPGLLDAIAEPAPQRAEA